MPFQMMIYPVAVMLLIYAFTALRVMSLRFRGIKNGQVSPKYYLLYQGDSPESPETIRAIRHYQNLYEMPVLFLIACGFTVAYGLVDIISLTFAWTYVILRVIHTTIHLYKNNLQTRFMVFAMSFIVLFFYWSYIILSVMYA